MVSLITIFELQIMIFESELSKSLFLLKNNQYIIIFESELPKCISFIIYIFPNCDFRVGSSKDIYLYY